MRVLTLTPQLFAEHCARLEALAADFRPDLIVTVARGGDYVGELMFADIPHVSVRSQRPSTARKGRWLKALARRMPLWARNMMRIAEARMLARRRTEPVPVTHDDDVREAISRAGSVLVVDDAVDSGASMRAVLDAIDTVPGSRMTAVAVITVTQRQPCVYARYALYRDGTLVRFPWSEDYSDNDNKES